MEYNSGRRSAQLRHQMERNVQARREHENYAAVWGSMKKYYDRWNSQAIKYNAWTSDNFKKREQPPSRINEVEDFKPFKRENVNNVEPKPEEIVKSNGVKKNGRNFRGPMSVYQREICDLAHWAKTPYGLETEESPNHNHDMITDISPSPITRLDDPSNKDSMENQIIEIREGSGTKRYNSAKKVLFESDVKNQLDDELVYENHNCPLNHTRIINHEYFERKASQPEIETMKNALELKIELDDLEADRTLVKELLIKLNPEDKLATNIARIKKDFLALHQRRLNSRPVDKLMLKELIQENVLQAKESITFLRELTGKLVSKDIIKELDPKISEALAALNGIKENDEAKQRFVYTLFDEEARVMLKNCVDLMSATTESDKKPTEEDMKAYADPTRFDIWDWTLFYASFETIFKVPVDILETILELTDDLTGKKQTLLKDLSPGTLIDFSQPKAEATETPSKVEVVKEEAKATAEADTLSDVEKRLKEITIDPKEKTPPPRNNETSIRNSIIR